MRNFIILLLVSFILSGSCASNSSKQQVDLDQELIKCRNQVNEVLDELEREPKKFILPPPGSSHVDMDIMNNYLEASRVLIENNKIALPLMFERLNLKRAPWEALFVYSDVFKETKSAESILYISDYIASASEEEANIDDDSSGQILTRLVWAAEAITSLKLIDGNRTLFDQRKDIADKLNQWYKEYKKSANPK